jgi:SAM-dependent methyltransferase
MQLGGVAMNGTSVQQRETAFHDLWAQNAPLEDVLVRECFEAPTAPENQFILSCMGPLPGKRVLDIGSGLGESSVYFALQGAEVTSVDISPVMIEKVGALGRRYGVHVQGIVAHAEERCVPESHFDFVYIANTIHHIENKAALYEQIRRALRPGGKFFSWDPIGYNPAINAYRRMATAVRTPDESPLKYSDVHLVTKYFSHTGHRTFWILTQALFAKYYLLDRVHPNDDRYWKRILRETPETLGWWRPLQALDKVLTRIPLLRWLAWNVVMWGGKPA